MNVQLLLFIKLKFSQAVKSSPDRSTQIDIFASCVIHRSPISRFLDAFLSKDVDRLG